MRVLLVELSTLLLAGGGWLPVSDAPCLGVGLKPFTILQEPVPALLELLRTSALREAFCTHCCVFIVLPTGKKSFNYAYVQQLTDPF